MYIICAPASCYGNQDKLQPDRPLESNTGSTILLLCVPTGPFYCYAVGQFDPWYNQVFSFLQVYGNMIVNKKERKMSDCTKKTEPQHSHFL